MGFFEFIISFQSLEKHVHHRYPAPPRAFKTQLCYLLHIILTSVKASSSAILHTKFLHWVSCTEAKKRDGFNFISCVSEAGFACAGTREESLLATQSHFLKYMY